MAGHDHGATSGSSTEGTAAAGPIAVGTSGPGAGWMITAGLVGLALGVVTTVALYTTAQLRRLRAELASVQSAPPPTGPPLG